MKSRKVLLFYPPNTRSVAMETICRAVKEAGHEIMVLTLSEKGPFHDAIEKMGIRTYTHVLSRKPSWKFFTGHIKNLVRFSRENKIDTIWSHMAEANLIALVAKRRLKVRTVVFRHHDESAFYARYGKKFGMRRNKREAWTDKIINRLAKEIVVLSSQVLQTMKTYEKCDEKKIIVCPLIYDFSKYGVPDSDIVNAIREETPCRLRLIMVSRMIGPKQHLPVFEILLKLIREGLSIKMIVMDGGPLREHLMNYILENKLERDIIMAGYKEDIINYMAASDLLMHPSLTEASNNVVKEMGYLEKTVAVCAEVGDFGEYIQDGINGFFMKREELESSIEETIRKAYRQQQELPLMGQRLKKDVLRLFADTAVNRERYLKLV